MAGITSDLGGSPDNFRQDNIAGPHGSHFFQQKHRFSDILEKYPPIWIWCKDFGRI